MWGGGGGAYLFPAFLSGRDLIEKGLNTFVAPRGGGGYKRGGLLERGLIKEIAAFTNLFKENDERISEIVFPLSSPQPQTCFPLSSNCEKFNIRFQSAKTWNAIEESLRKVESLEKFKYKFKIDSY